MGILGYLVTVTSGLRLRNGVRRSFRVRNGVRGTFLDHSNESSTITVTVTVNVTITVNVTVTLTLTLAVTPTLTLIQPVLGHCDGIGKLRVRVRPWPLRWHRLTGAAGSYWLEDTCTAPAQG